MPCILPAFCSVAYATRDDVQIILYAVLLLYDDDLFGVLVKLVVKPGPGREV